MTVRAQTFLARTLSPPAHRMPMARSTDYPSASYERLMVASHYS